MRKMTFNLNPNKKYTIFPFMKNMNTFSCHIQLDIQNHVIRIDNYTDEDIEKITNLVGKHFVIESIEIDNTTEVSSTSNKESSEESITDIIENIEKSEQIVTTSGQVVEQKNIETPDSIYKNVPENTTEYKIIRNFETAFSRLNNSISVEENAKVFIKDIAMKSGKMLTNAFIIACDIKKSGKRISYESLLAPLQELHPNLKKDELKTNLQESFKKWIQVHPKIAEECYKVSLISFLSAFAKRLT